MRMPEGDGMRDIDEVRKNIEELLIEEFSIRPDVRLFAFGGGAGRIASFIANKKIEGLRVIAINTDEKGLESIDADKKMHMGKDVLGEHRDTNGERKVAEYIMSRNKAWILEEANNADVIVLLAALGGGTGTGGILETAKIINERFDKPIVAIMILPFSIEGKRREIAIETVNKVKALVTKSIVLDSDILLQKSSVKVSEAYKIMYDEISNFVERITNVTRREIEKKFREMYLSEVDTIVEEVYANMLIAA